VPHFLMRRPRAAGGPRPKATPGHGEPSAVTMIVTVWPLLSATQGDYRVVVNPHAPRASLLKYSYLGGDRVGEEEAAPRIRKPQIRVVALLNIRGTGAILVPNVPHLPQLTPMLSHASSSLFDGDRSSWVF
jgi:hypothetical protein